MELILFQVSPEKTIRLDVLKEIPRGSSGAYLLKVRLNQNEYKQADSSIQELASAPLILKMFPSWTQNENREFHNQKRLHHPNIVKIFDFGVINLIKRFHGWRGVIMEYCNLTTLQHFLFLLHQRQLAFSEYTARVIANQLAAGLMCLRLQHILHGDFKPDNIFLHKDISRGAVVLKIGDFGRSNVSQITRIFDNPGRLKYIDEICQKTNEYNDAVEYFSFGMTLSDLVPEAQRSDEFIHLLSALTIQDQGRRFSFSKLFSHSWIRMVDFEKVHHQWLHSIFFKHFYWCPESLASVKFLFSDLDPSDLNDWIYQEQSHADQNIDPTFSPTQLQVIWNWFSLQTHPPFGSDLSRDVKLRALSALANFLSTVICNLFLQDYRLAEEAKGFVFLFQGLEALKKTSFEQISKICSPLGHSRQIDLIAEIKLLCEKSPAEVPSISGFRPSWRFVHDLLCDSIVLRAQRIQRGLPNRGLWSHQFFDHAVSSWSRQIGELLTSPSLSYHSLYGCFATCKFALIFSGCLSLQTHAQISACKTYTFEKFERRQMREPLKITYTSTIQKICLRFTQSFPRCL